MTTKTPKLQLAQQPITPAFPPLDARDIVPTYATLGELHAERNALQTHLERLTAELHTLRDRVACHAPELIPFGHHDEKPSARVALTLEYAQSDPTLTATLGELHAIRDQILDSLDLLKARLGRVASDFADHIAFTHRLP